MANYSLKKLKQVSKVHAISISRSYPLSVDIGACTQHSIGKCENKSVCHLGQGYSQQTQPSSGP